jgi:hypothetical protein
VADTSKVVDLAKFALHVTKRKAYEKALLLFLHGHAVAGRYPVVVPFATDALYAEATQKGKYLFAPLDKVLDAFKNGGATGVVGLAWIESHEVLVPIERVTDVDPARFQAQTADAAATAAFTASFKEQFADRELTFSRASTMLKQSELYAAQHIVSSFRFVYDPTFR